MRDKNNRQSRVADYNKFRDKCFELFNRLADSDNSHSRLGPLFSLNICPKGRSGGVDEKEIEIFYGNRPIGRKTTIGQDFRPQTKLETAHGATLSYTLTDNGHVICGLYPAASENQRPIEDCILLDYIKKPSELNKKYKKHWKLFVSYMEVTCLDGEPNLLQKAKVFYLRNFKQYIKDTVVQTRKSTVLAKEILKYVLTIWLSGFLILILTIYKDRIDEKENQKKESQLYTVVNEIKSSTINMSNEISKINEKLDEINKSEALSSLTLSGIEKQLTDTKPDLSRLYQQMMNIENELKRLKDANQEKEDDTEQVHLTKQSR